MGSQASGCPGFQGLPREVGVFPSLQWGQGDQAVPLPLAVVGAR